MHIHHGLPAQFRRAAALLYHDAFRLKFDPITRSPRHTIAMLERDFAADLAISAVVDGELVGLVGLECDGRRFLAHRLETFVEIFGPVRGWITILPFLMLHATHRQRPDELRLDRIVVRKEMRRQGVGTRLMEAVFARARRLNRKAVRLTVVDTNPDARRLYQRLGFTVDSFRRYPYIFKFQGYEGVYDMSKPLS